MRVGKLDVDKLKAHGRIDLYWLRYMSQYRNTKFGMLMAYCEVRVTKCEQEIVP